MDENEFRRARRRDEIRLLFSKIGFDFKLGKFNALYNRAKDIAQAYDDKVSVRDF